MYISYIDTPLGYMGIEASDLGVRAVHILKERKAELDTNKWSKRGAQQLSEYFEGERKEFDLSFDFEGYSDFYRSVWAALTQIPYGQTCSYLDIAKSINNPKAVRAVGMANGRNPIGIIIPCHRVIGADGSLTGYASGLEMKRWLLELEGAIPPDYQMSLF